MKLSWFKHACEELERAEPASRPVLIATVSQLKAMPDIGRTGSVEGTREVDVPGHPYRIIYRMKADEVQVLTVRHTSRQWPE
jgi:plasmid stabilization system protein ParE